MPQCTVTKRGNLSAFLDKWKPELDAVETTIKYAIAIDRLKEIGHRRGRFDDGDDGGLPSSSSSFLTTPFLGQSPHLFFVLLQSLIIGL